MPSYIVKQPDGKYAMFSTIVDDFTCGDMTEDEAVDACKEDGCNRLASADKLYRAQKDEAAWEYDEAAPPGQRRWMGAIVAIHRVHGEAKAQRRALLDFSEDE